MKAFILDGVMAGRITSLTTAEVQEEQWIAYYDWPGLRGHYMKYYGIMTSESRDLCIMSRHKEYTDRQLIADIMYSLTAAGAGEPVMDFVELRLDSGIFTFEALEVLKEMSEINMWMLQIQVASGAKANEG